MLGPGDCDYSLKHTGSCDQECTLDNIIGGPGANNGTFWTELRSCIKYNGPEVSPDRHFSDPWAIWNLGKEACIPDECVEAYYNLIGLCRSCTPTQAGHQKAYTVQLFLADASHTLVSKRCLEPGVDVCEDIDQVIHKVCCTGADICDDTGYPTVCDQGYFKSCPDTVRRAAIYACPQLFLDDQRLEGVYMDCGGDVTALLRAAHPLPAPPPANRHYCSCCSHGEPVEDLEMCERTSTCAPEQQMCGRCDTGYTLDEEFRCVNLCTNGQCTFDWWVLLLAAVFMALLFILFVVLLCSRKTEIDNARRVRINTVGASIYDSDTLAQ